MEERAGKRNIGSYRLEICSTDEQDMYDGCIHSEHAERRTCLLKPEGLPEIMSVRSLKFNDNHVGVKYDYRVFIDLITHFPKASHLECHVGVDEWSPNYVDEPANLFPWEYDRPRRDTRLESGKALLSTQVSEHLQGVELGFFCRLCKSQANAIHQYIPQPNLIGSASVDLFSSSLRILSYQLRELSLRVQADKTLFWPGDTSIPEWPNLQRIQIMFHMVSPSGSCYFEGPRGEGRELAGYEVDESQYPSDDYEGGECSIDERGRSFENTIDFAFRIYPNEQLLLPFLENFARAANRMPALKHAKLWSPLRWVVDCDDEYLDTFAYFDTPETFYPDSMAWGLEYCVPGEKSVFMTKPRLHNCEGRQIRWNVGDWSPNRETYRLFQEIGRAEHGKVLEERWLDDKFGHGLVFLDYFEPWDPIE